MELFKISSEAHSKKLTASGAANRWNKKGENVIYTGSTRSLSTLELVVHRNIIEPETPCKVMVVSIPDKRGTVKTIEPTDLPKNWRSLKAYSSLQQIGSEWYNDKKKLILKVPSAVIPYEYNFLINTEHEDFDDKVQLIRTENYFWDNRLL